MAINYSWNVSNVETQTIDSNDDVIINVHWVLKAEDDSENITKKVIGSQKLDISDLSNFVELNDVTESQLQGWVESAIGDDEVQSYKDALSQEISEHNNKPTSKQLFVEVVPDLEEV